MSQTHEALRSIASAVLSAGDALQVANVEERAAWLARAFRILADEHSALGRAVRESVPSTSGLSAEMVRWALDTSLDGLSEQALVALERAIVPPHPRAVRACPGELCVVVLSSNVFTAALRALAVPLMLGWPVLAKASSHDDAFAHALRAALHESDPALARAVQVVTFAETDHEASDVLFESADAVSVYGSDDTLRAIRARLSASVSFIGHGHGLGAALIGEAALASEGAAKEAARALALDVAAYDQRGCLSPHFACVVRDAPVRPEHFAELVTSALDELRVSLPRGALPLEHASAQLEWRAVASLRGELLEGEGFAVSFEADATPRLSPGYRNVQLVDTKNASDALDKLAPLGVHLKCLGVTGITDLQALAAQLPPRVAPRVCTLGTMQIPPADALQDGLAPWDGLVRWVDA